MENMTSAEFKTIRQKIGFSSQDMADYSGVALRTIQRIESGVTEPYSQPLEFLNKAYSKFKKITEEQRILFDQNIKAYPELQYLVLIRYKKDVFHEFNKEFLGLPESFHAALIGELKLYADCKGFNVKIVYFDPEAYFTFLGANPDSRENRAAWASLEIENIKKLKNSGRQEEFNK